MENPGQFRVEINTDLEAECEAELQSPETPSARERRLDAVAADLVLGLNAFPSAERRALHRRFRAVLEEFPHHSSHVAIHRLLAAGSSLEEIEEAGGLRHLWLEQPWLWGQKRRILGVWEVWRNPAQRLAFGWPTALHLVRTFGVAEAERAICEEWFDIWTGLQRHQASNLAEEIAFYTYGEFLRTLSHPILLTLSSGVYDEPTDREEQLEIRDGQGAPVWRFERKFPGKAAELSPEPARIRNHRIFDAAAHEDQQGLGSLQSVTAIEQEPAGWQRRYHCPKQACHLISGSKVHLSSETGHGSAEIVTIDLVTFCVVLRVPGNYRRLLANRVAIKSHLPSSKPAHEKPDTSRSRVRKKKNKA